MALASGIHKIYKKLFAIDDDGVRRIEGVLKKAASSYHEPLTVTYHVIREDDRFYESESVDEVLSDPNVHDRRVRFFAVELRRKSGVSSTHDSDHEKVAWVIFDKDAPPLQTPTVHIRISSPDKTWALMLADELEPQVTRLFRVKPFPHWIFLLFAPVVALIGLKVGPWIGVTVSSWWSGFVILVFAFLVIVMIARMLVDLGEVRIKVLQTLSVEPLFLWGEEVSNAAEREAFRRNFFWSVLVAFLVSTAAGVVPLFL